ncbi:MAG: hypothetical protein N3E45_05570 [Oscillatoriaceae bacterium SKW80]|nr:hypothetical protein [Oscillatoriaceae bacterium SKYG93]MCX8120284.1 hypothetical protein [Oscillatoriaceae bacterium SKW80]MDW8453209.1 calcium-binding protein [Oscillatoriaceae cyanobacterium SKYGB_i_bin93]HIK28879.1 hypothetical protein [Oscillatoriaceae cyanobacterium M7585_C2015_266]
MATFDINRLSGTRVFSDFVSNSDRSDFYRFRLDSVSDFSLQLDGLSQDANAALYLDINNNGLVDFDEIIAVSANFRTLKETIIRTLGAGNYIVEISNVLDSNTLYTLVLSAFSTGIGDIAGNTPLTGFFINSPIFTRAFDDFIGSADQFDFYRFRLKTVSDFSLFFTNLTEPANIKLYEDENNNGLVDEGEIITFLSGDSISAVAFNIPLSAGSYFVSVDNGADAAQLGSNTRYSLKLSANLFVSAIASDSNQLNLFKNIQATAIKGFARGEVLDLTPEADIIQLNSNQFSQFPGGVRAYDGNDTIEGSDKNDVIYGNSGEDLLSGFFGDDILLGGADDDRIFGGDGSDYLNGNKGNDSINGGAGNDLLRGGKNDDILIGGDGNDILVGDLGFDTLIGGEGADVFVLRIDTEAGQLAPNFAERIIDFSTSERIVIVGSVSTSELSFNTDGANTLIYLNKTNEILGIVENVPLTAVQNAVFTAASTDTILSF